MKNRAKKLGPPCTFSDMSSPSSGSTPHSVYHEAFPDDSRVPSPSSSSTSSTSSSSARGPPTWNPFERYPEFLEREKWLKEENQLDSENEEEFQRFVNDYEKYKAKNKVGEPFWEELRRSVPSFSLNEARDERYFIGYDEEGNEVRYDDEKHFLKRVRQSEILKFQAECRKVMKQREECRKRKEEEEKKRKGNMKEPEGKNQKATNTYNVSFVGKKQGLWRKKGLGVMNEIKRVKMLGESQYVVTNKAQSGKKMQTLQDENNSNKNEFIMTEKNNIQRKKTAEINNKRPVGKDEADDELKIVTKRMNAATCEYGEDADRDEDEDDFLFNILTSGKQRITKYGNTIEETENDEKGKKEESAFDENFLSDDAREETELVKRRSKNKRRRKSKSKEDEAGEFEHRDNENHDIIPGFEEGAEFNADEIDNGSDIDHIAEILKQTKEVFQPTHDDVLKTKGNYDSNDDVEIGEMQSNKTKARVIKKIKPKKVEETEEKDSKEGDEGETKPAISFRHSLKFQRELEEKKMKEAREKVLLDLADIDMTIEILMMDLEGRDASDNEESEVQ